MIEHIVLFRWSELASVDAIQDVMNRLRDLKNQVPGIIDLTCGEGLAATKQGYTHGVTIRFIDRKALEAYLPHSAHQQVVEFLKPLIAEVPLVFDYEC